MTYIFFIKQYIVFTSFYLISIKVFIIHNIINFKKINYIGIIKMDTKIKRKNMIINEIKNLRYTIDQLVLLKNNKEIEISQIYSTIYENAMDKDYKINYFKNALLQVGMSSQINELNNMIKSQEDLLNLQFKYLDDLKDDNVEVIIDGLASDNIIV